MNKVDTGSFTHSALRVLRVQALRFSEELTMVFARPQRLSDQGAVVLGPKEPGHHTYMSGRTLSDGQKLMLPSIMTIEALTVQDLPFVLWSPRTVRQVVKEKFDIQSPVRTVNAYLMTGITRRSLLLSR